MYIQLFHENIVFIYCKGFFIYPNEINIKNEPTVNNNVNFYGDINNIGKNKIEAKMNINPIINNITKYL